MSLSKNSGSKPPPTPNVDALTAVMRGLIETMRTWTDEDLAAFLAGDRDVTVRVPRPAPRRRKLGGATRPAEVERVRGALGTMETREEGVAYLERMALNRDDLRALVSALDLPEQRADNMEQLRNRIVEALIGYRLRSRAIRGTERVGTGAERVESKISRS